MDVWERERTLATTTVVWGVGSAVLGSAAALRGSAWWRGFGLQSAGWGVVDLAIALVARRLQDRRMRRHANPFAEAVQEEERTKLRRVLLVNAVADAGYVALGVVLARDPRPRVSGAGAAIVIQGGFLVLHDSWHAARSRRVPR